MAQGKSTWRGVVGIAAVAAVVCDGIGVWMSQHPPVFGGISAMGEPWSQARQTLIGPHVLGFGFIGGLLGALIGLGVLKYNDTNSALSKTQSALVAGGVVLLTAIILAVLV